MNSGLLDCQKKDINKMEAKCDFKNIKNNYF